jgi:hypothetical protein
MVYLIHSIFEGDSETPILCHVFPGETQEAALEILEIHASWDAFLRAAITTHEFQGMKLRVQLTWADHP